MYFYILDVEQLDDATVMLHGKSLEGTEVKDASTCKAKPARMRVQNVYSSILIKAVEGADEEVMEDVKAFMSYKNVEYTTEMIGRKNVFYSNLGASVMLMKITPKRRVSFNDFFSDYSEAIITEFLNPVENIIMSRKLRGPCIVKVEEYTTSARGDFVVRSPDRVTFVCNSNIPEMTFGSLSMESKKSEISKYCLRVQDRCHCGAVKSSQSSENGKAESMGYTLHPTHGSLLDHLNMLLRKENVDCIIYHNMPVSIQRRLDIAGKIRCDLFVFANGNMKGRDCSVEEMAINLGLEISSELRAKVDLSCGGYESMYEILPVESKAILQIFQTLDALQLCKEMSEISGYILNRTFQNLRAERIEYTLLHELYEREYLFPPLKTKKESKYTGGLVLDPQAGFYEDLVLLLDFNSLYPSIIQEFNVCFSTIGLFDRDVSGDMDDEQMNRLTEQSNVSEQGFLPKILSGFVKRRNAVKNLVRQSRSSDEAKLLDIRQKALKLTANSIYGCLGFVGSRFCNYTMAAYITCKGRELLLQAKRVAEIEYNMRIIYGDTDSVMIHTGLCGTSSNYAKALEQSKGLRMTINAKYRNIEIEVDKVFKKLLLYKKKKYAGLCLMDSGETYIEYRGLDLVRKDFCRISANTSSKVLELLLLDFERQDVYERFYGAGPRKTVMNNGNKKIKDAIYSELAKIAAGMQSVPVTEFIIHNTLSKAPENYGNAAVLPHVALALRLKERGMKFEQGDVVCYVIGKSDVKQPIHKRAYHPTEDFEIDYGYYVSNQILPSLLRIFEVVKDIHPQEVSRMFGVNDVRCVSHKAVSFANPCCGFTQEPSTHCMECLAAIPTYFYANKVTEMIRKEVEHLYGTPLKCMECGVTSRSHLMMCFNCGSELSFAASNQEFDVLLDTLHLSFVSLDVPEVGEIVRRCMKASGYRRIDLSRYFKAEIRRGCL